MSVTAIVPAAGAGRRMKSPVEKQFLCLAGKPVLAHTLHALDSHPAIGKIILALSPQRLKTCAKDILEPYGIRKVCVTVAGGHERFASVVNAFRATTPADSVILIHDAVRPFVTREEIDRVIRAASRHGAAALALPVKNTLKRARGNKAFATLDRKNVWSMQTPQVFKRAILEKAIAHAQKANDFGTDECYIVEKTGKTVELVEGSELNMKITTPLDFAMAEKLVQAANAHLRVGTGYDVHRLKKGRKLVLGGVTIPHTRGLLGHSDADVLCHAIADALLGAVAAGDIGKHFPNSDPAYKGISSLTLLSRVANLVKRAGYRVANVDATVVAQKPKIAGYVAAMRKNIAKALSAGDANISVKATTSEGLGFEGKEEGISAQAVAMVAKL